MRNGTPSLLGVGGAHIDRRGKSHAAFVAGASNPGEMREDVGGGVFNALRNARQRGVACTLFSVRGGDGAGMAVGETAEAAGITDISGVFLDRATASYTALIDGDGEVVGALADMGIYETAFPRRMRLSSLRRAIAAADAVLADANPPGAALERLVALAGPGKVHAIAVSPAKVVRFLPLLDKLACLFCNTREAKALTGASDPVEQIAGLRALGLGAGVITAGADGIMFFEGARVFRLDPPHLEATVDATGAGDALAGGAVAARMLGLSLPDALRHGVAGARLALQSSRSVPEIGEESFGAALALVPKAVASGV